MRTVRPGPAADRLQHVRLGLPVQVGGRLVQQQQRRVAEEGPGQGDPLALAGREPGAALAETGLEPFGQAGHQVGQAGSSQRPRWTSAVPGAGPAQADVVGDVPAKRCGRWGTQAIRFRQASGSSMARSTSPTATVPLVGPA